MDEITTLRLKIHRLPSTRERSLALTKLDEAEMWLERTPGWKEINQGKPYVIVEDPDYPAWAREEAKNDDSRRVGESGTATAESQSADTSR